MRCFGPSTPTRAMGVGLFARAEQLAVAMLELQKMLPK
jgi:hypothetical protein